MNYRGSRLNRGGTVEGTDARGLPQFPVPGDRRGCPDELDESEVVDTVERPAVNLRRFATSPRVLTPILGLAPPRRITRDGPPPFASAGEAPPRALQPSADPGPSSTLRPSLPPPNPPATRASTSSEIRATAASGFAWDPRGSVSSFRAMAPAARPLPPPLDRHSTIPGLAPIAPAACSLPHGSGLASPPATDHAEAISLSSIAVASDQAQAGAAGGAPRMGPLPVATPQRSAGPSWPITRPMLPAMTAGEPGRLVDLTPSSPRPVAMPAFGGSRGASLEHTPSIVPVAVPVFGGSRGAPREHAPSIVPVAMATSLRLSSRAADPTMQLRRRPRRSVTVVAALASIVAALLAGSVVAVVAVLQSGAAPTTALVDRVNGSAFEAPSTLDPQDIAPPAPSHSAPTSLEPAVLAPAELGPPSTSVALSGPSAELVPSATRAAPAASTPTERSSTPVIGPALTLVTPPASSKGHRIFVDGRVVGSGPASFETKCGKHTIKVGSGGKPRVVGLPCGGEITLD